MMWESEKVVGKNDELPKKLTEKVNLAKLSHTFLYI